MSSSVFIFMAFAIFAPLSSLFSFFLMVTTYYAWDEENIRMKQYHMSNIFWMSFSDFWLGIRSLSLYLFNFPAGSFSCKAMGWMGIFFYVAIQIWYFIISLHILVTLRFQSLERYLEKRYLFHMCVWSTCFIFAMVPFQHYVKDEAGDCWVTRQGIYKFMLIIPLTVSLWFAIIIFGLVFYDIWPALRKDERITILLRTTVFVGVFIFTWLPTWVNLILQPFLGSKVPIWIEYFAILLGSASGIFNFTVWFLFFPDLHHVFKKKQRKKKQRFSEIRSPMCSEMGHTFSSFDRRLLEQNPAWLSFPEFPDGRVPTDYSETYLLLSESNNNSISQDLEKSARQ